MLNQLVAGARNFGGKVVGVCKKAVAYVADKVNAVTAVVIGTAMAAADSALSSVNAADTVTLPTMPLDFAELATKGMVVVGTVLVAIAGIVIVIALCYMGLRKLSSAFSGRA